MRATESIIGNSAALAHALERVSQLAPLNRPILIYGERGTGKELAAERLHYLSPRWEAPLLKTNCAAIADSLLESELFGHEPGAFTGASRTHRGRFERADGGTLFLDELGTMSMRLQEKLLRLIEYGEFERLGGQQTLKVDVRVIAATNEDLRDLVAERRFRADLLDRLSFDVVHLPALRQRTEDIVELANHFAIQMCAELGWNLFPGFTDSAMDILHGHHWPGNIRELKNTVERSVHRWANPEAPVGDIVLDPFKSPYAESPDSSTDIPREPSKPDAPEPDFHSRLSGIEAQLVREALAANGHNQRNTAAALGLTYDQLRGLVRKHKLSTRKRRNTVTTT